MYIWKKEEWTIENFYIYCHKTNIYNKKTKKETDIQNTDTIVLWKCTFYMIIREENNKKIALETIDIQSI